MFLRSGKSVFVNGNRNAIPRRPVVTKSLYWLSYPDSFGLKSVSNVWRSIFKGSEVGACEIQSICFPKKPKIPRKWLLRTVTVLYFACISYFWNCSLYVSSKETNFCFFHTPEPSPSPPKKYIFEFSTFSVDLVETCGMENYRPVIWTRSLIKRWGIILFLFNRLPHK
jgi:hypothetical protein